MAGFLLSALSYVSHMLIDFENPYFVIGMILIVTGYVALFASKLLGVLKERTYARVKKTDDESANPKSNADAKTVLQYFGYAILAVFFTMIFFKPEFTLHVRFYDVFGAVGNFMLLLTKYIPLSLAVFPLVLYYVIGGAYKIKEEGWINKLQLVARALLALYYGSTWMSSMHLF